MGTYKVTNALKTGEFEGKYGKLYKYAVEFEGEAAAVEVSQKPETPAPKAGDTLNGTIQDTQYGKRFKKESAPYPGGGNRPNGQDNTYSIQRQVALKEARQAVADYYTFCGDAAPADLGDLLTNVLAAAEEFAYWFGSEAKPQEATPEPPKANDNDLPPVEIYDEVPY